MQDTAGVEHLYFSFLDCWNARDAAGMAALCAPEAQVVGFDGTEMDGAKALQSAVAAVFAQHRTGAYVAKVRAVRHIGGTAILRAVVGMISDGTEDLNPELNAVQTLVASHIGDQWRVQV